MRFLVIVLASTLACFVDLVSGVSSPILSFAAPNAIELAYNPDDNFVPLKLVDIQRNETLYKQWHSVGGHGVIIFRITRDQDFRDTDVLLLELEYTDKSLVDSVKLLSEYNVMTIERDSMLFSSHMADVRLESPFTIELVFTLSDQFVPRRVIDTENFKTLERIDNPSTNAAFAIFQATADQRYHPDDLLHLRVEFTDKNGSSRRLFNFPILVGNFTHNVLEDIVEPQQQHEPEVEELNKHLLSLITSLEPPKADNKTDTAVAAFAMKPEGAATTTVRPRDVRKGIPEDTTTTERVSRESLVQAARTTQAPPPSRRLLLTGTPFGWSHNFDAFRYVRNRIIYDLVLPQLVKNLLQAQFVPQGLLFEMASDEDVEQILKKARMKKAKGWDHEIEETDVEFNPAKFFQGFIG